MLPPFLQPNDEIRIVSPSGSINQDFIDGSKKVLALWGLLVSEGDFARSEYGRFAGTKEQRIADQSIYEKNIHFISDGFCFADSKNLCRQYDLYMVICNQSDGCCE